MDSILDNEDLAAFNKLGFTGRLRFEGSAPVSIDLQDCGIRVAGVFGELLVPYELLAHSRLWSDSAGAIRIATDHLLILLDIEPTGDKLPLFARLEEWMAGFNASGDDRDLTNAGQT